MFHRILIWKNKGQVMVSQGQVMASSFWFYNPQKDFLYPLYPEPQRGGLVPLKQGDQGEPKVDSYLEL
jgi:hypothetical protein